MKKIMIRLDEPVHTFFARLAAERQVSLSQLINETLARFVVAEKSIEMMEARAARARPGATQQVLDHTAAHGLTPLPPEDAVPSDVNRGLLETRLREERSRQAWRRGSKQTDRRDEVQSHRG